MRRFPWSAIGWTVLLLALATAIVATVVRVRSYSVVESSPSSYSVPSLAPTLATPQTVTDTQTATVVRTISGSPVTFTQVLTSTGTQVIRLPGQTDTTTATKTQTDTATVTRTHTATQTQTQTATQTVTDTQTVTQTVTETVTLPGP